MKTGASGASYFGISVFVALPFAILLITPEGLARDLLGEDRLVESTGALAWLAASGFFMALLFAHRKAGTSTVLNTFWIVGLGLMCFVGAGEEISWGQRLFGYDTPGVVARTNLQGEMNLHNLELLDVRVSLDGEKKSGLARWLTFNRVSSLIWLGYLVALPVVARLVPLVRSLVARWKPPVPPLRVALAATVNYATFFLLIGSLTSPDTHQKLLNVGANEIKESVIAVLFAWTAYACLQRARASKRTLAQRKAGFGLPLSSVVEFGDEFLGGDTAVGVIDHVGDVVPFDG